ncbi:DegT/DnrJ/EryC1/StrS family aminotransferase [Nafulsella turpanensis]|uniref:DegT/DnrJ/EryC1/StrS family aminotransferase n=1 Tax=Nafulsella turpanensis TaxID=1265690 RepID=UPI00036CC022|nr:DegT/DnrJ/EryC1/StrS family aminotransferase [Nafulsella turpanensis]
MSQLSSIKPLQMVDLHGQYLQVADEINQAIQSVIDQTAFINGAEVKDFARSLAQYNAVEHVIPCGNGTDALQLAMMALQLQPGDEVIVPTWTYVATVEVIALLGLKPVFVDADPNSFNLDTGAIEALISPKTKAIVPVHLYGQCAHMEPLLKLATEKGLYVIEDTAQALGADYLFSGQQKQKAGTLGTVGTTSFFPSKNLGCYGDGGALLTHNSELANTLKAMANHGQFEKYHHDLIGVNSRLDSLQAAILNVKLKQLDNYTAKRQQAAKWYDQMLAEVEAIQIPERVAYSTHVFHQYTIKVKDGKRDALRDFLKEKEVPSMIYYPVPLHLQKAYSTYGYEKGDFPVAEALSGEVLSLPIHTELEEAQVAYVAEQIKSFFHG